MLNCELSRKEVIKIERSSHSTYSDEMKKVINHYEAVKITRNAPGSCSLLRKCPIHQLLPINLGNIISRWWSRTRGARWGSLQSKNQALRLPKAIRSAGNFAELSVIGYRNPMKQELATFLDQLRLSMLCSCGPDRTLFVSSA